MGFSSFMNIKLNAKEPGGVDTEHNIIMISH